MKLSQQRSEDCIGIGVRTTRLFLVHASLSSQGFCLSTGRGHPEYREALSKDSSCRSNSADSRDGNRRLRSALPAHERHLAEHQRNELPRAGCCSEFGHIRGRGAEAEHQTKPLSGGTVRCCPPPTPRSSSHPTGFGVVSWARLCPGSFGRPRAKPGKTQC